MQVIEIWCNGSTTDFGSVCPGSNPGISTRRGLYRRMQSPLAFIFTFKVLRTNKTNDQRPHPIDAALLIIGIFSVLKILIEERHYLVRYGILVYDTLL